MYRKLFIFVVTTLTILTANLLTNYISAYLISYKSHLRPITFTLLAMGIICIVFYPLFTKLEEWLNKFSSRIVRSGKSFGGKYLGLLFMFIICLLVLTYFYAKLWYHIDLLRILFQGKIKYYY
jgi:hypothetical protein